MSRKAFDVVEEEQDGLLRFSYRLKEGHSLVDRLLGWINNRLRPGLRQAKVPSLYGFVAGAAGDVQMGIYFDDEQQLALALALWRGVDERKE